MRRSQFFKRVLRLGFSGCAGVVGLSAGIQACQQKGKPNTATTAEPEATKSYPAGETWQVAIAPGIRPFAMEEDGKLVGFDIDLIQAIAAVCQATVQIQSQPFDGLVPAMQAKQIDIAMGAIASLSELPGSVEFSQPYFQSGIAIATHLDNKAISNLKSLKNRTIAVALNSTGAKLAIDISGSRILTYDQNISALKTVETGKADAALVPLPTLLDALKTGQVSQLKQTGKLLERQKLGVMIRAQKTTGQPTMLAAVNKALSALEKNGTYGELHRRWLSDLKA